MADEELGTASVKVTLDDSAIDTSLNRLSDRIERALNDGARDGARRMQRQLNLAIAKISPLRVEIAADTTRFRNALNSLNNLGSTEIRVVPGVDPERFRRELQRRVRGIYVRIPVRPDFDGFDAAVRAHRAPPIDVRVRPDVDGRALQRTVKSLGGVLSKLGGIAGITLAVGGLGIASAGAAVGVGALVAALAPAVGIIAAGPAAILGFQAALGALKLALSGVSDAFSAALTGDAAKFEKTLEELSPKAQAAAREVRALKPAFDQLRKAVQDSFFGQFEGDITKTAEALQGPLKTGLTAIAAEWGRATKAVLGYVQGASGVTNVQSILTGATSVVAGLADGTNKLTAGFLQAADAVSSAFGERLGSAISARTQQFGEFLSTAAGDGRLVAWVEDALAVLSQLGRVLGNIGGILSGVFGAASAAGGGFLGNLERITQSFETFVKSAEGQQAITNIFRTLATVAAQLGPIFAALVQTVGAIAPALAPLFTTIGPAIVSVIQSLGPLIQGLLPGIKAVVDGIVGALGEIATSGVLADIGKAFGDVLRAIAPLLPVIGQLVASFAQSLAPVIQLVAEALTPVITAIANALTPLLPPLVDVVLQLVDAFTPLVDTLGVALAEVITALAPLLLTVAQTLGLVAQAVAPLIVQLTNALLPIIQQLAPFITRLVEAIAPLVEQFVAALLPALPPLVDAFVAILEALAPLTEPVVQLVEALAPLITLIISALGPIITFAAEILKWVALNAAVPFIENIVGIITTLITVLTDVTDGVVIFVNTVVDFFTDLDTKVSDAVSGLVDDVGQFFSDMVDDASQKAAELVADVIQYFQDLPGRARSAMSSLGGAIGSVANEAANTFVNRIRTLVADATNAVRELPGKAKSALGSLGSFLYSAGVDLVRGMINGVKDKAGDLVSAARSVVGDAVQAAKDFLGIKSPSRVFYEIGRFVGAGFVNGMTASAPSIKKTADALVKLVVDAFKGKAGKTKLDDNLIKNIRATQKQLEGLVKKREALAERIKKANEFVAQTTESTLQAFSLNNLAERSSGSLSGRGGLINQVQNAAARIRRFTAQIAALAKRGLRKDLLAQLIGLGPEAGADLANQLSQASNSQLRELNAAQKALDAAAKKFGQNSADQMFDAGKNASKGFLAGLKSQQKEIETLMINIAKGLTKAIRKALGIKSPSRVLRGIGINTGQGLVNGLAFMQNAVARAAETMAANVVAPFQPGASVAGVPVRAAVRPVDGLVNPFGSQRVNPATGAALVGTEGRRPPEDVNITNNIVINEVGNAEATAHRVINRLALVAGL